MAYLGQVFVFVQPDEVAVVQRFGRFRAVLPPGPHLRLPPPWDTITRERPARIRSVVIGLQRTTGLPAGTDAAATSAAPVEWTSPHQSVFATQPEDVAQILTGDQSLVELVGTVQYRVVDVRAYRFGVREPERVLAALAEGAMREAVAEAPLLSDAEDQADARELLSAGRGPLEQDVRRRLQTRVDALGLGIEVLPEGVCLLDLHPPRAVVGAFRDVSSAFKEKERLKNEAQAYYRDKVINAAGQTAWRMLAATADPLDDEGWNRLWSQLQPALAGEAAARVNGAACARLTTRSSGPQGEATSFQEKMAARETNPELTELRLFLETLQASLPGKRKLILDPRHGGRRHLVLGWPSGRPPPAAAVGGTSGGNTMNSFRWKTWLRSESDVVTKGFAVV